MFEVTVTRDMVGESFVKAQEIGVLHNSIEKGEGNLIGCIGEFVVAQALDADVDNTFDYDLVKDGKTVDVKTKKSGPKPKGNYEASVADFNTAQKCDYYFFVRVTPRMHKAYVLGFYPKTAFYADSKFHTKGEYDFSNNFKFHADCHNIRHDLLLGWDAKTPEELRKAWQHLTA